MRVVGRGADPWARWPAATFLYYEGHFIVLFCRGQQSMNRRVRGALTHLSFGFTHDGVNEVRRGRNFLTMDTLDDEEADDDFSSFGQAAGAKTAAAVSLDDE